MEDIGNKEDDHQEVPLLQDKDNKVDSTVDSNFNPTPSAEQQPQPPIPGNPEEKATTNHNEDQDQANASIPVGTSTLKRKNVECSGSSSSSHQINDPPSRSSTNVNSAREVVRRVMQKSAHVPTHYKWAKERRAKIQPLKYLLGSRITVIRGAVQCKNCTKKNNLRLYEVLSNFRLVATFVLERPTVVDPWRPNNLARFNNNCEYCQKRDSCVPKISNKKRHIDWLFLLLGQFIEYCTDSQLRYYCKHNQIQFQHGQQYDSASRATLIHATYWTLCHQLDSSGLFNISPYFGTYH